MSILATELEWPEGTKFFEVQCRLGIWDVDGWDLDKEPEVKTLGGTVRITPRTPAGRIRLLEPDGKYRVVVAPPLTFAINEFTGRLVNTADNTEGVWVVDPSSETVDPKDFTYSAVVTPKVGSPFTVEFDGTVAINGVYDLANGTTVAPSRGVSVLESRIAKLEQEGGLPNGDIPIFATLAEAMAYEAANPGSLALTIESVEPDTTPPTLGTLTIAPNGTSAEGVVSSASDDRGHVEYSFKLGSGAWSEWQTSPRFTFSDLSVSTDYTATHRVRDRAGNTVEGYSQSFTTLAEDMWGTLWTDDFSNNADGSLIGQALDSPSSALWLGVESESSAPAVTGGAIYGDAPEGGGYNYKRVRRAALVELPSIPSRVEISVTGIGNAARRIPLPLFGRSINSYNSFTAEASSIWLSYDPSFTHYTEVELAMKNPDGTAVSASVDGWNLHTWKLTIDAATRLLNYYQDGVLMFSYTPPPERWLFGKYVGFHMHAPNSKGYISAWSVRWE